MQKSALKKFAAITLLSVMAVCVAVIVTQRWRPVKKQSDAAYLSLLREAYTAVSKSYVEKPDEKKLVKSMVDGMLAALDPHSAYLPPEPFKEMTIQMSGAFGGVGIELGMKEGRLTVIAPIDDTPAYRAGILANDHIWKIDGASTRGMSTMAAVKLMRGEKGTPVTLTILRGDQARPLVFPLVRDIIKIKSLKARMLDQGVGYIRISQFQERTGSDFRQALQELHTTADGELKGLVIDLRYNPGGVLGPCIEVANCFIGDDIKNTLIVSTKGRERGASQLFNATLGTKEPRYPMVVLINGGSASASEILAGALQDHKRAIVMGKQSFGKGSVQSIIPLKDNAALKLTTARYYTPSGRSIQAKGIVPDIIVDNVKPLAAKNVEGEFKEKDLDGRLAPEAGKTPPKGPGGEPAKDGATPPPPKGKEPVKEPAKGKGGTVIPKDQPKANGSAAHGINPEDLEKDYQLQRALELLKSLNMVKEQGFPVK